MTLTPDQARQLAKALLSDDDEPRHARPIPERIGRYRIVRHIGTGGMGEVYEAEQDHPRRRVALKVIRPDIASPEVFRRFDLESSILAKLQHPGIAQVFDAGRAPGTETPYFAMEFVEGRPLLEYAATSPLKERLSLFLKVCDAVEHAHRRGIIHRDLKPANILVDAAGQPRILDFGIARATDADIRATTIQTDIGKLVGTLPYMSPEQAGGDPADLDTRSDVYSLGVILYELLAGKPPYEIKRGLIPEALRIIKEVDPAPLSTTNRTLRGDLETITSKSLAKERERRYQSVSELAADLRRYLSDQPIEARPPSAMYQIRKFARRNRAVFGVSLIAFATLVAATIATTALAVTKSHALSRERIANDAAASQARIAAAKAEETNRQQRIVESVKQFLIDALGVASPSHLGPGTTVLAAVNQAVRDHSAGEDPEVEAAIRDALGDLYMELGEYVFAADQYEAAAAALRSSGLGGGALGRAIRVDTGWTQFHRGDRTAALASAQSVIDEHIGDSADLDAWNLVAVVKLWSESEREALDILARIKPEAERRFGPASSRYMTFLNNYADALRKNRKFGEAEPVLREVLDWRERYEGPESFRTLVSRDNLAKLLMDKGERQAALTLYESVLESRTKTLGDDHPRTMATTNNLGLLLCDLGDTQRGLPMLVRVLDYHNRTSPRDHHDRLIVLTTLGYLYSKHGDLDKAERSLREVHELRTAASNPNPAELASATNNLAQVLLKKKDYARAAPFFPKLFSYLEASFPPDDWRCGIVHANYAECLQGMGKHREAQPHYLIAYASVAKEFGERHERAVKIARQTSAFYHSMGNEERAIAWAARHSAEFVNGKREPPPIPPPLDSIPDSVDDQSFGND